jgi:3-phenylpropionate/trans-cinnamate dioxygenase ferredoxin reductase subunit
VRRILFAGAGLAALRTAEQLRTAGWTERIVVAGAEPHPPYNRPPLTKEALRSGIDLARLTFPRRPSVDDVEWRLGVRVTGADLRARRVTLDDGTSLAYDGLVIATGVRSRVLHPDCHRIRTVEDASRLRARLVPDARLTVIGAGFIGCEVAAAATGLGCIVTVVEPLETPLQAATGSLLGAEVRRRHEEHGVRFRHGRTVVRLDAGEVVLDDGSQVASDVVVEAVGSVPNVEWLDGNGLDLSDGVLCDEALHPVTSSGSLPEVVAVGDVARFPIRRFGETPCRIEHWTMPGDTARHAAASLIAGLTRVAADVSGFAPLPTFWSELYGVRIQSFGLPAFGLGDVRVLEGDLRDECAIGYHRDGILVGVVLIGMQARMLHWRQSLLEATLEPQR